MYRKYPQLHTLFHQVFLALFTLLLPLKMSAQIPLYQWRAHLSFVDVNCIAPANSRTFAATSQGLFYFNRADNSLETITRIDGLSDSNISAIGWSESANVLVAGYENGNLDLIQDDVIRNLSDIKRKTTLSRKNINNITIEGDKAYLSCGFGIVKLNLTKQEIAETWFIGPDASAIEIFDLTFDQHFYWAATEAGIFRAEKTSPNLQDYAAWERMDNLPGVTDAYHAAVFFDNKLVVHNATQGKLYQWDGLAWQAIFGDLTNISRVRNSENVMTVVTDQKIDVITSGSRRTISTYNPEIVTWQSISPTDAFQLTGGELWIGDNKFGLIRQTNGGTFDHLLPTGPAQNNGIRISTQSGNVYVATGTRNGNVYVPAEIHRFSNEKWTSINANNTGALEGISDIVIVTPDPANADHYFGSVWGKGLIEFNDNKVINHFTPANSPLEEYSGICWVGSSAFDNQGNLWMTNALVQHQIHVLKPNGEWKSFNYPGINSTTAFISDLLITQSQTKWVVLFSEGLYAFHNNYTIDEQNDDSFRKVAVRSIFTNSETTITKHFNEIYCITEDQDGALWVGTNEGVVVYYNPDQIFRGESFYGIQPSVDLGDGLYHPLLESEVVTAIAVDGGNRKWFGTMNSGVFLFSEDGETLLRQFNTDNSPLLSNFIYSIAIDEVNGEVFFSTNHGLISYMSDASGPNPHFQDVYAFPNPVRETYHGDITIQGLKAETDVRITDIAGNLVYQTTSEGGRAIWDGDDSFGRRVNTGVYLVLMTDQQGDESAITKILFIR